MLHNFSCDYSWTLIKDWCLWNFSCLQTSVALCFSQFFPSALSAVELRAMKAANPCVWQWWAFTTSSKFRSWLGKSWYLCSSCSLWDQSRSEKWVLGRIVDSWSWVLRAGVESGLSRWKVVWAGEKAGESGQDRVVPANLLQSCQRRLWKAVLWSAGFLFMEDGLEGMVVKIQDQCRRTLKGWEVQGKWKEWQL